MKARIIIEGMDDSEWWRATVEGTVLAGQGRTPREALEALDYASARDAWYAGIRKNVANWPQTDERAKELNNEST